MNENTKVIKKFHLYILIVVLCIVIVSVIFILPFGRKDVTEIDMSVFSSVYSIGKLATLKSYYHNVAMYEALPDGGNRFFNDVLFWPFGGYSKVGYKQFWLEYSGIVETGIEDVQKIQVNRPNAKGVLEVFVPDAKVLSVYADENSLTEPLSENGWFTTISGKEKAEAFATAQNGMREEAENDQALLSRAKENAKKLVEKFIINTGNEMGYDLSVSWIEKPY